MRSWMDIPKRDCAAHAAWAVSRFWSCYGEPTMEAVRLLAALAGLFCGLTGLGVALCQVFLFKKLTFLCSTPTSESAIVPYPLCSFCSSGLPKPGCHIGREKARRRPRQPVDILGAEALHVLPLHFTSSNGTGCFSESHQPLSCPYFTAENL